MMILLEHNLSPAQFYQTVTAEIFDFVLNSINGNIMYHVTLLLLQFMFQSHTMVHQ